MLSPSQHHLGKTQSGAGGGLSWIDLLSDKMIILCSAAFNYPVAAGIVNEPVYDGGPSSCFQFSDFFEHLDCKC